MHEHTAAINRVLASPDSRFFVTCSDDGCLKVWDCAKLERQVVNRSRLTFRCPAGVKIKTACFLENSYCVAIASDDGIVQIIKIDCNTSGPAKYGRAHSLRKLQIPDNETPVHITHFASDTQNLLLIATSGCKVLAVDPKSMAIVHTWQNAPHHGSITALVVDRKRTWLLLGTSKGILNLWDLRFQLCVKSTCLSGKCSIAQLAIHPNRGRGRYVLVATIGPQAGVLVWDLEKSICREFYTSGSVTSGELFTTCDADTIKSEGLVQKATTEAADLVKKSEPVADMSTRALACGIVLTNVESRVGNPFMVTCSRDRRMRIWDLGKPSESCIVMAPALASESRRVYSQSTMGQTSVIAEQVAGKEQNGRVKLNGAPTQSGTQQQTELLQCHLDLVLDVTILTLPYQMIASVDRSGVLKVYA
jgi:phosphoinositide-3-kinase regulatory subunit 4